MHARVVLGAGKGVLFREVSLLYFRSVSIEEFHCIYVLCVCVCVCVCAGF